MHLLDGQSRELQSILICDLATKQIIRNIIINKNDEQKWSEISGDIANVAKKIKSRIDEEDLVEDLKDTFKNTIESTSQLITNILHTVESTVTDEEIKKETKEIVTNVNAELKNLLNQTRNKFSESHNSKPNVEEE